MNKESIELWREGVMENCHQLESILSDRVELKNAITSHLKMFFDFDKIQFSNDLNVITLSWEYGHDVIINEDNIHFLGLDWIITTEFNDELGQGVVVKVYPFGFIEVD